MMQLGSVHTTEKNKNVMKVWLHGHLLKITNKIYSIFLLDVWIRIWFLVPDTNFQLKQDGCVWTLKKTCRQYIREQ